QGGGCNPIPVKHERRGTDLVMKLDAMTAHAPFFKTGQRITVRCSVCRMDEDLEKAGQVNGKWHCAMPGLPCKLRLEGKN
ncbi:MAG TPA: hypothetical protein VM070_04400, partial [Candidatus Saccharimonadales bacterium]|nr:hypothetical protein [Candidatus Saccharimonadales bacterium]